MKKTFRVATADITIDGRNITREQLEKIAKNYDIRKYQAMINLEHFYYGGNYGKVLSVEVKEDDRGLGLFAELEPNEFLLNYNKQGQKLFTSIEIVPNFPEKGEYYLGGIAITDNPASQGVDMLEFSRKMPEHYKPPMEMSFGNYIESEICFAKLESIDEDDMSDKVATSIWQKISEKFNLKKEEKMSKELEEKLAASEAENAELKEKYNALLQKDEAKDEAIATFNKDWQEEKSNLYSRLDVLEKELADFKAEPMSSQRCEATGSVSQDNPSC